MEKGPSLRALFVFSAVGRLGSMTRAAAELEISPGAVSQQIKALEESLNVRLITRKASGLALTDIGHSYHVAISKAFADLDRATEDVAAFRVGDLFVSALPLFASRWLASRLFEWQQAHPEVKVHLEGAGPEPIDDIGRVDFRITYLNRARQFDNNVELFTDSLIPVCSQKIISEDAPLRQPADLQSYRLLTIDWKPLVSPPPTWGDWFKTAGVPSYEAKDTFIFSLSSLAIEAAIEGRGVTLAQCSMVADDLKEGRLIAPFPQTLKLPSPYCLAWDNAVFDKNGARDFHRWLIGLARRQQASSEAFEKA